MNKYYVLEIGDSAYTEFKSVDGDFERTEDAVLVDIISAKSKDEAEKLVRNKTEHKNKLFDRLFVTQIIE